jgi:lysozyme
MQFSEAGLRLLKRFEGFRSQTYLDVAGLPTIGYGHRLLAGESFPNGIPEPDASNLLAADVRAAELAVNRLVKAQLTHSQYDALVDFVYNLGEGRLAGSTLLKELNLGNYQAAGQQLLRWDHAGGEEVAGLKSRREAEFELWRENGIDEATAA